MILLSYIIFGAIITAVLLPLALRSRNVSANSTFLNNLNFLTIVHSAGYLGITLYIMLRVPLPAYYFKHYLFIDSLAVYEVLITSVIFLLASVYGHGYIKSLLRAGELKAEMLGLYYSCFNLLMASIVFAFFSNNLALFWILLELTTLFSAVLIVTLGARENIVAALKYVFIASTAMLFSVVGLIILFSMTKQVNGTGTLNWSELMQSAAAFSPSAFVLAFAFIFIGFAAKAGIIPFHTWLPQAHAKAPSVVSTILSGVLLNCGIYGILRLYAIAARTPSQHTVSVILIIFGVLSMALAAFSMLPRSNIKKLIAFSSIEHMGLMLVGIGLGTFTAIYWTLFHILLHSLIKALLFFSAGILHRQYESNKMLEMPNALRLQPLASWGLIIGSIAILGIPPSPVFLSKLFILIQVGAYSPPVLFLVLVLFLIVAGAFTFLLIRAFSRHTDDNIPTYHAHWTMRMPIVALFVMIIGAGIYLYTGLGDILTQIVTGLGF
jgi:hydrogenase-4 component F